MSILLYLQLHGFSQKQASKTSRTLLTDRWESMKEGPLDYIVIGNPKDPQIFDAYGDNFHHERKHFFKSAGPAFIVLNLYDIREEVDELIKKHNSK